MSKLLIDQSLSQKGIGAKQEVSLMLLQKGFVDLAEYIQSIETDNPFLEVERKKDISDFKLVKYNRNVQSSVRGTDFETINAQKGISLHEHLNEQLALVKLDRKILRIAARLILHIDDSGYFLESIDDVAKELDIEPGVVLKILKKVIQRLEPAGVGARNISECMLLQLSPQEKKNELLTSIIKYDLILLAQNKLGTIAKKYAVKLSEVIHCCDRLRKLNPKPGITFSNDIIEYVFPDIIVERNDEQLCLRLAEDEMMYVSVNNEYAKIMMGNGDTAEKEYVRNKIRQAKWLCDSVRRRRETLQNIAERILKTQEAFFYEGCGNLCPMTMSEMAASVGVHESTVSRAVADKYLQCDWGMFELKYFFSPNINGTSAEALKSKIEVIILKEQKDKPISDQRISEMLREDGIIAARRTVAKYRAQCGIPSASQRKQHYKG